MRQITKRQLDRQGSKDKIKEWLPFELVIDGEVIAELILPHSDSQPSKAITMTVNAAKPTELRLSKARQAQGRLSSA